MSQSLTAIAWASMLALACPASAQDDAGTTVEDAQPSHTQKTTIIAVNIDGAGVSINGTPVGRSPISPQPLQAGDIVEVRKPGFAPLRYEHDGRSLSALYLERLEPLAPSEGADGGFPWIWVGMGAGVVAAAAIVVIIVFGGGSSSEEGIPIPRIER